jgi:hypothetical protein
MYSIDFLMSQQIEMSLSTSLAVVGILVVIAVIVPLSLTIFLILVRDAPSPSAPFSAEPSHSIILPLFVLFCCSVAAQSVVYYRIQLWYRKSSRELQRLESIAR